MAQEEGNTPAASDAEIVAKEVLRLRAEFERRFEEQEKRFLATLLQQHAKTVKRFQRLEGLLAEKVLREVSCANDLLGDLRKTG